MNERDVVLTRQPIELFKLLKFEGLAGSGGEAKHIVSLGLVTVNGELETRKTRKLVAGDVVEFNGESLRLVE